jgi:hypothetical protein
MGAVDKFDMKNFIERIRKSMKGYNKLFLHFFYLIFLNMQTVYNVKMAETFNWKIFCLF